MTDRAWHCDRDLLERYMSGRADGVLSASVEAHLVRCALCRAAVAELSDPDDLSRAWTGVRETIQRPATPFLVRLLRRLGLSDEDGVLLSGSQSLRGPWALATIAVLGFAALASASDLPRDTALYLLVAPLVPVLGVVAAFATADPGLELVTATPYSKTRLAVLRTLAVTATSVPFVTLLGLAVPGIRWLAIAWLGPALGLTAVALLAMTWWPPEVTGWSVSLAWAVVVGVAYGHRDLGAAVQPQAQLLYLLVAALAGVVLAVRVRSASTLGGYA